MHSSHPPFGISRGVNPHFSYTPWASLVFRSHWYKNRSECDTANLTLLEMTRQNPIYRLPVSYTPTTSAELRIPTAISSLVMPGLQYVFESIHRISSIRRRSGSADMSVTRFPDLLIENNHWRRRYPGFPEPGIPDFCSRNYYPVPGDIHRFILTNKRYIMRMKFPRNRSLLAIARKKIASSEKNISFR